MHDTYEAVEVGASYEAGPYEVTREEIITFAEQYDPQPFHMEPDNDFYDDVIASGWHTGAISMRLMAEAYINRAGGLASPGLEELQWRKPVFPGDSLWVTLTIDAKEPWDRERGLVLLDIETRNQEDRPVLRMLSKVLFPRE